MYIIIAVNMLKRGHFSGEQFLFIPILCHSPAAWFTIAGRDKCIFTTTKDVNFNQKHKSGTLSKYGR
jgi:hypothetical protein